MANVVIDDTSLAKLANTIRAINGETTTYTIDELAPAILALPDPTVWTTWEEASWPAIYKVCKGIQSGLITEWPEDIVIGATKRVNLSTPIVDAYGKQFNSFECEIIGIDIDGTGVLTFQTKGAIYMSAVETHAISYVTNPFAAIEWQDAEMYQDGQLVATNLLRQNCNNFYNYSDVKNYIKPLNKYTGNYDANSESQTTEPAGKMENVWLLSEYEVGVSDYSISANAKTPEATLGIHMSYPKFTDARSREKKELIDSVNIGNYTVPWWLRSTSTTPSGGVQGLYQVCAGYSMTRPEKGLMSGNQPYTHTVQGFAPCFAIG